MLKHTYVICICTYSNMRGRENRILERFQAREQWATHFSPWHTEIFRGLNLPLIEGITVLSCYFKQLRVNFVLDHQRLDLQSLRNPLAHSIFTLDMAITHLNARLEVCLGGSPGLVLCCCFCGADLMLLSCRNPDLSTVQDKQRLKLIPENTTQ